MNTIEEKEPAKKTLKKIMEEIREVEELFKSRPRITPKPEEPLGDWKCSSRRRRTYNVNDYSGFRWYGSP